MMMTMMMVDHVSLMIQEIVKTLAQTAPFLIQEPNGTSLVQLNLPSQLFSQPSVTILQVTGHVA